MTKDTHRYALENLNEWPGREQQIKYRRRVVIVSCHGSEETPIHRERYIGKISEKFGKRRALFGVRNYKWDVGIPR